MERPETAKLILQWKQVKQQLDDIETKVKASVMESGRTWEVQGVKATLSKGRRTYDYREVGGDAPEAMVEKYTKVRTSVDWRKLVLEGMCMEQDMVPFTRSEPSVKLTLTQPTK